MKSKLYLAAVALAAMAMFNGCSQDGPVGPTGPQGPQGPAGYTNVTTNNLSEAPGAWVSDGAPGGWQAVFTATNFDPTLGAVCGYSSTDDSTWAAMPSVGYIPGVDFNYSFTPTFINVYYDPETGSSIAQPTITWYFKFVVIAPSALEAHPNLNLKNFRDVKSAFNLRD